MFRSWLLWQLMMMGITFDNGQDGWSITITSEITIIICDHCGSSIANSLSSGGSFLSKIGRKYFKIIRKPRCNERNPDKFKLVNYNRKICIPKIFKCKILVGKTLTIQHPFVKFVRLFHRQGFALYGMQIHPCMQTHLYTPCK